MEIIARFFKWVWEVIKLPITFAECLKLLKEVNSKLDSPFQYNQRLDFAERIYKLQIQQLNKEKEELAVSDSEKKAQIQKLLNLNEERLKQIDFFKKRYEESERERKKLTDEIETSGVVTPTSFGQAILGAKNVKPMSLQDAFLEALNPDKKHLGK